MHVNVTYPSGYDYKEQVQCPYWIRARRGPIPGDITRDMVKVEMRRDFFHSGKEIGGVDVTFKLTANEARMLALALLSATEGAEIQYYPPESSLRSSEFHIRCEVENPLED